jgi:hypothetical protein
LASGEVRGVLFPCGSADAPAGKVPGTVATPEPGAEVKDGPLPAKMPDTAKRPITTTTAATAISPALCRLDVGGPCAGRAIMRLVTALPSA